MIFQTPALPSALLLVAGVSFGCPLTPIYEHLDVPIMGMYPQAPAGYAVPADFAKPGGGAPHATRLGRHKFFPDMCPQRLIGLALGNDRDLRVVMFNVEVVRTQHRLQITDLLPSVNASAMYTHSHTPPSISTTSGGIHTRQYQFGTGISNYQTNPFSVSDVTSSACASYLAVDEGRRAAQISLISQMTKAYLNEYAYAEQLDLVQQTLEGREDCYRLVKQRFDISAPSALDPRQTETLAESIRVSVVQLTRQYAQATNALVLLADASLPADLPALTMMSSEKIVVDIPPGLPSEPLEQRPDIRQAGQKLIAVNVNIGVAWAAPFPSIGLTLSVDTASDAFHDLFKNGTQFWSFVPNLTLSIFNQGTSIFNLDLTKTNQKTAVTNYEKAIQTAFHEVPNAFATHGMLEEQVITQRRFRNATAGRLTLSDQCHRNGVSSFLDVPDVQRDLFSVDQTLAQTRLTCLTNAIDLYTVLGGGLQEYSTTVAVQQVRPTTAPGVAPTTPGMMPQ